MADREDPHRTAKIVGGATVVVLSGVVVLGTIVGAVLAARAGLRACRRAGATRHGEPEELASTAPEAPAVAARTAAVVAVFRLLAYWGLSAVAAVATWLAGHARPARD